eukprot:5608628-Prymnesium_polylepis.1
MLMHRRSCLSRIPKATRAHFHAAVVMRCVLCDRRTPRLPPSSASKSATPTTPTSPAAPLWTTSGRAHHGRCSDTRQCPAAGAATPASADSRWPLRRAPH